jgi:DNA-binding response OmpR family regulator
VFTAQQKGWAIHIDSVEIRLCPNHHFSATQHDKLLRRRNVTAIAPEITPHARKIAQMSRVQALLVEDDVELAGLITRILEQQAIDVLHAASLAAARQALDSKSFSLLILDIMLPDGNGLDLCREARQDWPALPVLMLSARGNTIDRVVGLELGADDYVAKPFDADELAARIRSLLRRKRLASSTNETQRQLGRMRINMLSRTASIDGFQLELSATEYKVLLALSQQPGKPISREQLSRTVQPGSYLPSNRSVDVQVVRLRRRLRDADPKHEWVITVRGEGYAFALPNDR